MASAEDCCGLSLDCVLGFSGKQFKASLGKFHGSELRVLKSSLLLDRA